MNTESLIKLARILARHRGLKLTTISTYAANDGKLLTRLQGGASITIRRHDNILQWFSDDWPSDLEWPPDIPRPTSSASVTQAPIYRNGASEPSPDPTVSDPLESVTRALERRVAALDAMDMEAALAAEEAAITCGSTLNAEGQIASPRALCLALGVPRYVYDQVVRTYADGRPGQHKLPRRLRAGKSASERMLRALIACGDARFQSRRPGAAVLAS